MLRNSLSKLHRALTFDCEQTSTIKLRKRLFSEHQEESNEKKRTKKGLVEHESEDKQRSNLCSLYTSKHPCVLLHSTSPLDDYSPSTKTETSIMKDFETLVYRTDSILHDSNNDEKNIQQWFFLPCHQLSNFLTASDERENCRLLVVDCGIPFRFHERHINNALLLNITDRLSRRRLATRGFERFLDASQLERFKQSDLIVLYDDSIHLKSTACSRELTDLYQLSTPMQSLLEQIQRYDPTKKISILHSTFDDFAKNYPQHCHIAHRQRNEISNDQPLSPEIDPDLVTMSEILPGLYLGNENDAKNRQILEQNGIGVVLNISTDIPCYYADDENFIEYRQIHCLDTCMQNILEHFDETFKFMNKKIDGEKKNVFVHCYAGISRSPSFVIGYLMKYHSKTFKEALQLVQSKRQIINPNLSFLSQLHRYEQILKPTQVPN